MRSFIMIAVALVATLVSSACGGDNPSSPSTSAADIPSLVSTDVTVGTGTQAAAGRIVTVHYTLWLYSATTADHHGTRVESSRDRNQPYTFVLGTGSVIRGWDQGVVGMRVGGMRTLSIPSSLGYGASGNGTVPPNSALVFDIELLGVQ
jgi:FKBP-type peptidyl-prolyl cis-trans isomerase FkpA